MAGLWNQMLNYKEINIKELRKEVLELNLDQYINDLVKDKSQIGNRSIDLF